MNHRPTNKRTLVLALTVWFWFSWFVIQSLLVVVGDWGRKMALLTDWMLGWLHTGCPVCDQEKLEARLREVLPVTPRPGFKLELPVQGVTSARRLVWREIIDTIDDSQYGCDLAGDKTGCGYSGLVDKIRKRASSQITEVGGTEGSST